MGYRFKTIRERGPGREESPVTVDVRDPPRCTREISPLVALHANRRSRAVARRGAAIATP
jgi:hypothetical protein